MEEHVVPASDVGGRSGKMRIKDWPVDPLCALARVASVKWGKQHSDLSGSMRQWQEMRLWTCTQVLLWKRAKKMGRGKRRGSLLLFGISLGEITGYYYVNGNDPIRCRWERGELLMWSSWKRKRALKLLKLEALILRAETLNLWQSIEKAEKTEERVPIWWLKSGGSLSPSLSCSLSFPPHTTLLIYNYIPYYSPI